MQWTSLKPWGSFWATYPSQSSLKLQIRAVFDDQQLLGGSHLLVTSCLYCACAAEVHFTGLYQAFYYKSASGFGALHSMHVWAGLHRHSPIWSWCLQPASECVIAQRCCRPAACALCPAVRWVGPVMWRLGGQLELCCYCMLNGRGSLCPEILFWFRGAHGMKESQLVIRKKIK